jgi:phage shock protein A
MPGLSGRFNTLVKAKVSAVLDRAEDPAETLDYSYEKQLELLQQTKSGILELVTSKKRMQQQEGTLRDQAAKLDGQARQALAAGNEDLSRQALTRKQAIQDELGSLDQQIADLENQQQQLTDSEAKLQTKVEAFRTKKEVIKAQYSAADAQVQISEAATGVGEQMADVGLAMQRAIDKTENMKARADAVGELEQAGTFDDLTQLDGGKDDLDRQLEQVTSSTAVDSELQKMKAELAAGTPAQQLPSGDEKGTES